MDIDVQSRDFPLTEPLREALLISAREYRDAYRRLVRKVAVRVHDVNGPDGGIDKACVVIADLTDGRVLVCTEVNADLYRAIPGAFAKARRGAKAARRRQRARLRSALIVSLLGAVMLEAG